MKSNATTVILVIIAVVIAWFIVGFAFQVLWILWRLVIIAVVAIVGYFVLRALLNRRG